MKLKKLIKFLRHLEGENGFYHVKIFSDGSGAVYDEDLYGGEKRVLEFDNLQELEAIYEASKDSRAVSIFSHATMLPGKSGRTDGII